MKKNKELNFGKLGRQVAVKPNDEKIREVFRKYAVNEIDEDLGFKKPYFYASLVAGTKRLSLYSAVPNDTRNADFIVWGEMYNQNTGQTYLLLQTIKAYAHDEYLHSRGIPEEFADVAFFLSNDNLRRVLKAEKRPFSYFDTTLGMKKNTYLKVFGKLVCDLAKMPILTWNSWLKNGGFGGGNYAENVFVLTDAEGNLCHPKDLADYIFLPYLDDEKLTK